MVRGDDLLARYDELPPDVEWLPLVHARALPGGAVEREFYESIKAEILERLRAVLPVDGIFLDIHGAMSVIGMRDAEGDLAQALRETIGPHALVSAASRRLWRPSEALAQMTLPCSSTITSTATSPESPDA